MCFLGHPVWLTRQFLCCCQHQTDNSSWRHDSRPSYNVPFETAGPSPCPKLPKHYVLWLSGPLREFNPLPSFKKIFIYWFERERETTICCSIYQCIYWLILVCALTGDQIHNLSVLGQSSNQLRHPTTAIPLLSTTGSPQPQKKRTSSVEGAQQVTDQAYTWIREKIPNKALKLS